MKIKYDFITNSSSTAFYFIFKGGRFKDKNRERLFELIRKYRDIFDLSVDYGIKEEHLITCNHQDIISDIDKLISKRKDSLKFISLDELINNLEKEVKRLEKQKEELEEDGCFRDYFYEYINETNSRLNKIKELKSRGLNRCIEVEFGNSGMHEVSSNSGTCMDYERPTIDSDDFVILIESRH